MEYDNSRATREPGTHAAIYPSQRVLAHRNISGAAVRSCTPGSRVHVSAVASEVLNLGCHLHVRGLVVGVGSGAALVALWSRPCGPGCPAPTGAARRWDGLRSHCVALPRAAAKPFSVAGHPGPQSLVRTALAPPSLVGRAGSSALRASSPARADAGTGPPLVELVETAAACAGTRPQRSGAGALAAGVGPEDAADRDYSADGDRGQSRLRGHAAAQRHWLGEDQDRPAVGGRDLA
jgi:hypothetical protein